MRLLAAVLLFVCVSSPAGFAHDPSYAERGRAPARPVSAPLNLNEATVEQLDELPGVGPALAERIVVYRDEHGLFERVEQLGEVRGIGPRTLEKLRPLLVLE